MSGPDDETFASDPGDDRVPMAVVGEPSDPSGDGPGGPATGTTGPRVARRRPSQRPVAGRTAALIAVVVVLVGVGLVSLAAPPPSAPSAPSAGDGAVVAPVDAQVGSFFCTTGSGIDAGAGALTTVVLTNTTRTPVHGVAATVGQLSATPVLTDVVVPARGSVAMTPPTGSTTTAAATTFSFPRGGITGTAVIAGPQGWSTAPCTSQVAGQWDFAGGATATGLLDLSLYNPTAAASVVDVTFLTASGTVLEPQAYQGLALVPGQLVVEALGAYVQNQAVVATLVQATSGALVATELDDMVVPSGSGLALLSGSPGPGTTWRFAQTTAVNGGSVTLAVANPGSAPVTAAISVGLPGASVEPHQLSVPGNSVATFTPSATAGWPLGSPYSLTVSASGPVIVGRTVVAPTGAAAPQGGIATGTTSLARYWLVVGPGVPGSPVVAGGAIRTLAVADPGPTPVAVTVSPLGGGAPVVTMRVPAGGVIVPGQNQVGGLRPLMVSASGPVTVEADESPTGAPGIVSFAGFPISG